MRRSSRYVLGKRVALVIFVLGLVWWTPWGKVADQLAKPPEARRIYEVGLAAMKKHDLGGAQAAAEALIDREKSAPFAEVLQGFVHLRSGRLREATKLFERAREDPQTSAIANMLAGEALYRNRQIREAIDALSAAIIDDPSLTDAHRQLGAIWYDLGSTEPAVRELRIVSKQAPDDPRPHRLMGSIYMDMESYEQAIVEYREALRRDPQLPERGTVLVELSTCLLKLGRYKEALATIQQCPRTAEVLAIEAESRFSEGDTDGAGKLIHEALALAPHHLESLVLKGTMQLSSGAAAEAVQTLREAVDHHPKDFRAHYKLSQAYMALGQADLARKHADEFTTLRNLRAQFTELHAKAAADTGNADLRYQLGMMARELDRPDLAISWYSAAIALDPNHAPAREALRVSVRKSEANRNTPNN